MHDIDARTELSISDEKKFTIADAPLCTGENIPGSLNFSDNAISDENAQVNVSLKAHCLRFCFNYVPSRL